MTEAFWEKSRFPQNLKFACFDAWTRTKIQNNGIFQEKTYDYTTFKMAHCCCWCFSRGFPFHGFLPCLFLQWSLRNWEKKFRMKINDGKDLSRERSGCGSVGRAVASDTRGLQFKSGHRQNSYWNLCIQPYRKMKMKKTRPGMAHFQKKIWSKTLYIVKQKGLVALVADQ